MTSWLAHRGRLSGRSCSAAGPSSFLGGPVLVAPVPAGGVGVSQLASTVARQVELDPGRHLVGPDELTSAGMQRRPDARSTRGQVHLPTGRTCGRPALHAGGCEFVRPNEVPARVQLDLARDGTG